jgi:hypothetical protein
MRLLAIDSLSTGQLLFRAERQLNEFTRNAATDTLLNDVDRHPQSTRRDPHGVYLRFRVQAIFVLSHCPEGYVTRSWDSLYGSNRPSLSRPPEWL